MSKPKEYDLTDEVWREYEFGDSNEHAYTYRIEAPKSLFLVPNGTTHRVLDSEGVVHCVPAVGRLGCVLRWKPKPGKDPVAF
jgi:hypothetical protein